MEKQYDDTVVDYWKMSHNNFMPKVNAVGSFDSEVKELNNKNPLQ